MINIHPDTEHVKKVIYLAWALRYFFSYSFGSFEKLGNCKGCSVIVFEEVSVSVLWIGTREWEGQFLRLPLLLLLFILALLTSKEIFYRPHMPNSDYHEQVSWPDFALLSAECVDTVSLTSALLIQGPWAHQVVTLPSGRGLGGWAGPDVWPLPRGQFSDSGKETSVSEVLWQLIHTIRFGFCSFFCVLAKPTWGLCLLAGGRGQTSDHCRYFLLTAEQILFLQARLPTCREVYSGTYSNE